MSNTIDVEATAQAEPNQSQALARRQEFGAVEKAMGVKEIIAQVKLIQEVMREVMTEGEHYGTIPGCGTKKTLLQPGAQKLTMTFRLAPEYTIQETDLDRGHKEFRVICTLKSIGTGAFVGQGVGCCSSMESKYRYRGGARKCPKCGKEAIIMGKKFKPTDPEPGWLCWKKKEGCGATWPVGATEIESQSIDKIENENPADTFNTVLKIAKKRAYVDATITATAASDIFTQDIGDPDSTDGDSLVDPGRTASPPATSSRAPAASPRQPAKQAMAPPPSQSGPTQGTVTEAQVKKDGLKLANDKTRAWMIDNLKDCRDLATEFYRKLIEPTPLMPNEQLEDMPLQFVPISKVQMGLIQAAIADFGNGDPAVHPFAPNPTAEPAKPPPASKPAAAPAPPPPPVKQRAEDWFFAIIMTVPRKGMKKADYDKHPDTILSLYTAMKTGDEEAQKRLWGLAKQWAPGPREYNGKVYQPSQGDLVAREALDAFIEWEEKHGKDTVGHPLSPTSEPEPEDDVPF